MNASDLDAWFVREVLPLEAMLVQFLRRSWRNRADVDDLCQEVYVRIYEAAQKEIPDPARPFVFAVARNLFKPWREMGIVPVGPGAMSKAGDWKRKFARCNLGFVFECYDGNLVSISNQNL